MTTGSAIFLKDSFKLEEVDKSNKMSVDVVSSTEILSEGQLEEYDYDTEYENIYKTNLSLSEPLRSVGDVKDRLFRDDSDGLWKIERNLGRFIIDSGILTADNSVDGSDTAIYRFSRHTFPELPHDRSGVFISSHFKSWSGTHGTAPIGTITRNAGQGGVGHTFYFVVDKVQFPSMESMNNWLIEQYGAGKPVEIIYELLNLKIETLDQELQDKLNNLRSFQDSNYVYTIINGKSDIISENLKPTLHATFKGGGWYSRWKTEKEFERQQEAMENKADSAEVDAVGDRLEDYVLVEGYEAEIGELNQALQDYKVLIDSGEVSTDEAIKDIETLLGRTEAIENNFGEFTESWNFEVTEITMGEEGLFIGDNLTEMGIRIAPQVGDTPPRIDFVDNGTIVAEITGQYMRINRGIFVQSATIGEHKIETIAGGHTIWQWV